MIKIIMRNTGQNVSEKRTLFQFCRFVDPFGVFAFQKLMHVHRPLFGFPTLPRCSRYETWPTAFNSAKRTRGKSHRRHRWLCIPGRQSPFIRRLRKCGSRHYTSAPASCTWISSFVSINSLISPQSSCNATSGSTSNSHWCPRLCIPVMYPHGQCALWFSWISLSTS